LKPFAAILSVAVLLAFLVLPGSALDWKVLTVSERSLSLDLGPSFEIYGKDLNVSGKGMVSQDFLINDTAQAGAAYLSVMSIYDQVMRRLDPGMLTEIFLTGGIMALESRGDVEIGNWTATDSTGANVTVHTLQAKDPRLAQLSGTYEIACWNLDGSTYALMASMLDKNTTRQVIENLTIT